MGTGVISQERISTLRTSNLSHTLADRDVVTMAET
jgi:hypothetical protein